MGYLNNQHQMFKKLFKILHVTPKHLLKAIESFLKPAMITFSVLMALLLVPLSIATAQIATVSSPILAEEVYSSETQTASSYIKIAAAQNEKLETLHSELREIKTDIRGDIKSLYVSWWEKLLPAGIGFIGIFGGALIGGWITWRSQTRQLAFAQKNARSSAAYDSVAKIMDFRAQQLNEFYSPMRFLLHRTGRVRRQLCDLLLEQGDQSMTFEYRTEDDGREHLWVTTSEGEKKPFRLIEHLHVLARNHSTLMPLVDEIVLLGQHISTLIHEKGGLSRSESPALAATLGEYLGHYSILKDAHLQAKESSELPNEITYSLTYPRQLDGLLDNDINYLTATIAQWEADAKAVAGIQVDAAKL